MYTHTHAPTHSLARTICLLCFVFLLRARALSLSLSLLSSLSLSLSLMPSPDTLDDLCCKNRKWAANRFDASNLTVARRTLWLFDCAIDFVEKMDYRAGIKTCHARMHTGMHTRTHAHKHSPTLTRTNTHAHTCTHTYVHTHARMHTCTHAPVANRHRRQLSLRSINRFCVTSFFLQFDVEIES